ncbi:hypothetical protein GYMLUDRAFT_493576 [Collybiopsis luxurians FD-317 M1]|uniref:Unplaced genomic scaffold GYMLUscaffold_181, whole genome shotgun sequence n=1 Tax=Collybiopsis luxurians FD-317 M1 TaxID=944289 RepID=A0A0D0C5Y3_9AGAR|nr:hypothetical protein GYMLUDRAFT_493576 [Collybiopsis luxurians FD-317 M1]
MNMLLSLFLSPSVALPSCKNQPLTINRGESLRILFGIPIPTKSVLRGEIHHAPSIWPMKSSSWSFPASCPKGSPPRVRI